MDKQRAHICIFGEFNKHKTSIKACWSWRVKNKKTESSRRMTAEVNDPICFVVEKDTRRNDLMKRWNINFNSLNQLSFSGDSLGFSDYNNKRTYLAVTLKIYRKRSDKRNIEF